jgi:membrane protease YdiL (CAAX protease family)
MLRHLAGPLACLPLYALGGAQGPFPLLATLVFASLLHGMSAGRGRWAAACAVGAGALFLAIGYGLVPGFARIAIGDASLSSGKALAGVAAMAALPSHWRWNRRSSAVALACLALLPLLGWASGFVRWAPATPEALATFALANLFSVVAEEWFFRRWVQQPLQRYGAALSIGVSALLFGLAHFAGGPGFMLFAGLAGLAYAGVYRLGGGSTWAAVALHWALNVLRKALFGA